MDITAVMTVAAQVAGASGLVTVSSSASGWLRRRAAIRRQADIAKEILGLTRQRGTAYRHDSRHVLYTGTQSLHPDNLRGLLAASGNDFVRARESGMLRIEDEVRVHAVHDLVLIGSPTAEGVSRLLFGYALDGTADSLSYTSAPVDLAYRWIISKNEISESAVAKRLVPGRGWVERPNWRIVGPNRIYVPQVDEDGVLLEDYLLVTKVRNYLSRESVDRGHSVISFGGTHGTGTRAIELIFRNPDALSQIADQLRNRPSAFQVLFRVGDIKHSESLGSHARKIELVEDAVLLPDNDQVWDFAVNSVERNL